MSAAGEVRWADVLGRLLRGEDLPVDVAEATMRSVMAGDATDAQVAGLVTALRMKGESAEEITGFVRAMRSFARTFDPGRTVVDTCGTGGDGAGLFNVSTVAAVVVAGAGVAVAKHGNRAASGRSGSADLLEAWGVAIDLPPDSVRTCIDEVGIGFCFAPSYHPAIRFAMPARRQLGIPTVFNYLGPLTNPAGARRQTIGVSDPAMAAKMADVLARLGTGRAFVFHGSDGLDELTTTGTSHVWEVRDGDVQEWTFDPRRHGIAPARLEDLRGGEVEDSRRIADEVLAGKSGPARDIVLVAAAAGLLVGDAAEDWDTALEAAARSLDSGAAAGVLERWITVSTREASAASE